MFTEVVVKWTACSPSNLTVHLRILLDPTVFFSVKFMFEKNEYKYKEAGIGPI